MPADAPAAEPVFDRGYIDRLHRQLQKSLDDIAQFYLDTTNRVDEYRVQSLAGESLTTESLQPDYECDEIITSVVVTGPVTLSSPAEQFNLTGSTAAAPAAGTAVVTGPLMQAGIYEVEWTVELSAGPPTAADQNNFGLYVNGVLTATSVNPGAVGTYPQQTLVDIGPLANLSQIIVKNIGAGSAATVYSANIVGILQPANAPTYTLQLGKRAWTLQLPPSGIQVIGPIQIKMGRSDQRNLIASVAGDWSMELMGFAETGRRGRV